MKDSDLEARFQLRLEEFRHGDFQVQLVLPVSSESLIDESEFNLDERLPYWAELWPSARALARYLLDEADLPERAIELGCGVALPSLALRSRGVAAIASDYYEDALLFARHNAARNDIPDLGTVLLDWREPAPGSAPFPLVIAADVLYESRNAEALQKLLPGLVAEDGRVIFADPGRVSLPTFLKSMETSRWRIDFRSEHLEPSPAGGDIQIRVHIIELSR